MSGLKRTPLYPLYAAYEAVQCVDFGGWELPVQFIGIQKEHEAVRNRAGLFDVSHMGEILVTGYKAEAFVQRLTTNDVTRLAVGQAQYSLMCDAEGGVVDDLLVYRLAPERFMLVVNASNIQKDYEWMKLQAFGGVALCNVSAETALLALQGPRAEAILSKLVPISLQEMGSFRFAADVPIGGAAKALISRTGYTGEDGFEIYLDAVDAPKVWTALLEAEQDEGLLPAGLGARDTLRFEARLPLYGHELSPSISPLEAGLQPFVKLQKGEFIGRDALLRQKQAGLTRRLAGIEMTDRGIPRAGYKVFSEGNEVGTVTSGSYSPTLKKNLGLALLPTVLTELGTEVDVEIRGKLLRARVVATPFYKR